MSVAHIRFTLFESLKLLSTNR